MAKDSKNWESPLEKTLKQQQELARRIMDGRLLDDFKDLQEKINKPYKDLQVALKSLGNATMGQLGSAAQKIAESHFEKVAESQERSAIEQMKSIGRMVNRSFTYSLSPAISSVVDLQSFAGQQALNMLNTAGSIESVAASITLANRSFADSSTRLFSTSAIVGLQSFVNQRPLNMLKVTELLRPVIKLSQSTISADLFIGSVVKSLSMSSLAMPTVHLRIPTAIESPQSIFKSYQPIFAKQEEWKDSLFSPVQRQTTQKALTNDTDLESSFIPLKSNEYRKDLFTPESPSWQPQLLVPQAIESSDPDAYFDPVFGYILTQVEQYLRFTIEKCLTKLSGSNWIKQRVPHDMRERWKQRQEEDKSAGRPVYSRIQYADFMDLASIIIQANNWRDVFESIFKNKNEVQVSLQRLHPIRKSIAHSRPLSKSDRLTLASEANRIFSFLGLSFSLELSVIRFHLH